MSTNPTSPIGEHIRTWRQRRRLSQLDLAVDAEISTKHLSFLETGRSRPSREMVLHLSEHLNVPLRDQNTLLQAAGYAPKFSTGSLDGPDMTSARRTIDHLLKAHEPFPALAVDRHWNLVLANQTLLDMTTGAAGWLLEPPINVIRLSLHPDGIASNIVNYVEWRHHLIDRLQHQFDVTADDVIAELIAEIRDYPVSNAARAYAGRNSGLDASIAIPLVYRQGDTQLSFMSTTTIFGTPIDVTLSELAIETFFPADDVTAAALNR